MDYLFYTISGILFLFVTPGLALFPRLIQSSITCSLIPVVSAGVVSALATILITFELFNPFVVGLIAPISGLIALYRSRKYIQHDVKSSTWYWWAFVVVLLMPYAVKLGTNGFDSSDELYSWNVWALQYVHGWKTVDFFNTTMAPYPQFFSKFLAFGYQWLGSTEYQLPLKASLIMIPGAIIAMMAHYKSSSRTSISRVLLILWVVFATNCQRYFDYAYADPLMCASLMGSLVCFFRWVDFSSRDDLFLCIFLALTAAYSKQPALIWSAFSLPVLLQLHCPKGHRYTALLGAMFLITGSLFWVLGQGSGFHDNGGVLNASFQARGYMAQFFHAAYKHMILNPAVGLLFLVTLWRVFSFSLARSVMIFWCLPSIIAWLLFGAYDLRLGMHTIYGMALLLCYCGLPDISKKAWMPSAFTSLLIGILISLSISGVYLYRSSFYQRQLDPLASGQVTLAKYFGRDSEVIYQQLYNQWNHVLWAPTDYITALFYMKANMFRPTWVRFDPYHADPVSDVTKQVMIDELLTLKPTVVFIGGRVANRGRIASESLEALIQEYPSAFRLLASPPNRYGYYAYWLDIELFKQQVLLHSHG
jgi:hypothetical protein